MVKRARRKRAGRRRRRTGVGMAIVGSLFAGLVTRELGGAVMSRGLRESRAEKGVARFCFFFICTADDVATAWFVLLG